MNAQPLFTHALTPLQAGTGQGIGVIDLPIAREVATGIPYLPGSSLKGVLRDRCREQSENQEIDKKICIKLFGPETTNADAHAGAVQFSDQRLLLFPVRTLKGTFAWVTSPFVLARLARDCDAFGISDCPSAPPQLADEQIALVSGNALTLQHNTRNMVVLEDLDLNMEQSSDVQAWGEWISSKIFTDEVWRTMLQQHLCIVHDDVFAFLLETATQVTARIRLKDDTKTVQKGGLWYEEALPAESVLYGLVIATPVKKTKLTPEQILEKIELLTTGVLQLGGSATVGRGLCRLTMTQEVRNADS